MDHTEKWNMLGRYTHIKNKPVLFKQYLPTINLKIIHRYNFQNSGFNFGIFFSFLWLMKLGDCSDTSDECFYFCIGHCTCMWAAFICEAVLSITQYSALTCYRCTCTLCDTAVFFCGKNIYWSRAVCTVNYGPSFFPCLMAQSANKKRGENEDP